ncbi:MAG TPA: hypothetical protein VGA69_02750 [Nitriliruptorales bacterium]
MREEDIREFIDGLDDPRGFETPTTAVDGWPVRHPEPEDVLGWLEDGWLRSMRRLLSYPDDPPCGVAVVEDGVRGRLFEQSPCETGTWFLTRVGDEALQAAAPWLFVMVPQVRGFNGRMWQSWAADTPLSFPRFTWYFEARGRGRAQRMWGEVIIDEAGATMGAWDLDPPRHLEAVLRGHPARRRHRLRPSAQWS